ncbi:peptide-methionine (R)-S-oxide reductase MsrB [Roseateles sp. BYS180W]|uniref:Peptide methionine sulfoxide reductase MsrB n=1 Tax=Roseateles rivi TaxID=3299028 RepID=A0ABW7FVZ4_9BURK
MSDPKPESRSDAQWRELLDETSYLVTRRGATEPAFTGRYWNHWEGGDYLCVCCGKRLFASDSKFDAGCGWPSFSQEDAQAQILRIEDLSHGMRRVEVRCSSCDAHLGHVFPDGPAPTGERYCINSAAIDFSPRSDAPPRD